jgi:hypothetical protein
VARLAEADLGTQLALVQFLGILRARAAALPILEAGRDEALAQVALGTLAAIGPAAAEEIDAQWARLSQERRRAACEVLGRVGGARAVERLVAELDDADPLLRAAAARAIGALRVEKALAPLVRRVERAAPEDDPEGDTERSALCEAIAALAGPDAEGRSPAIAPRAVELLAELIRRERRDAPVRGARARPDRAPRGRRAGGAPDEGPECARAPRRGRCDRAARARPHSRAAPSRDRRRVRRGADRRGARARRVAQRQRVRRSAPARRGRGRARARDGGVGGRPPLRRDPSPAIRAAALEVLGRACEDAARSRSRWSRR